MIARLSKPRFYVSGQLLSSHSEIKKHRHFCCQFGTCILEVVILEVSNFWTFPGIPDVEKTLEVSASGKNHEKNQLAAGDEARFVSFLVSLISILLGSFSY